MKKVLIILLIICTLATFLYFPRNLYDLIPRIFIENDITAIKFYDEEKVLSGVSKEEFINLLKETYVSRRFIKIHEYNGKTRIYIFYIKGEEGEIECFPETHISIGNRYYKICNKQFADKVDAILQAQ